MIERRTFLRDIAATTASASAGDPGSSGVWIED